MAPHLNKRELHFLMSQRRKTPAEIRAEIQKKRARKGILAPNITNIRKAVKGITYKRGMVETRGRKPIYSKRQVSKMNTVRKHLLKKAKGEREVRWSDIQRVARVPNADRGTCLKAFKREGIPIGARRPRLKPARTPEQAKKRLEYGREWSKKPEKFWEDDVDLILDNKKWEIPTTERARRYLAQQRVRFHLRTPSEGSLPYCTKPDRRKNRLNTGAQASVCAGISNGKVVLWEYCALVKVVSPRLLRAYNTTHSVCHSNE